MMGVPRLALAFKSLPPAGTVTWRCTDCETPFAAASEAALTHAFDAHVRYVNAHGDRATDPHFADQRLDALAAR